MIWSVYVDRLKIRKCPQVLAVIAFQQEKKLRVATLFCFIYLFFCLSSSTDHLFLLFRMNREIHNNKAFDSH